MALPVFGLHAGMEPHGEGVSFHGHQPISRMRRVMMGMAIVTISSRPMKMDMTIPGTFSSPNPKVDRKSVGKGKSVSIRVEFGGRRIMKTKKTHNKHNIRKRS